MAISFVGGLKESNQRQPKNPPEKNKSRVTRVAFQIKFQVQNFTR